MPSSLRLMVADTLDSVSAASCGRILKGCSQCQDIHSGNVPMVFHSYSWQELAGCHVLKVDGYDPGDR
jgi:hypothetical protein